MNKSYWTYKADSPPDYYSIPLDCFKGTKEQWESLSPAMRREIWRSYVKQMQRSQQS